MTAVPAVDHVTDDVTVGDLRRQVAELELRNKELEGLAHVAAHDIQEPLRVIRSCLEIHDRRFGERVPPEGRELLHHACDGAARLSAIVSGVLAHALATADEEPHHRVELRDLVDAAVVALFTHRDGKVPVIHIGPLEAVWGSPGQLQRLVQNLLSNAAKFHDPEATPEIWVSTRRVGATCELVVADNGVGIDPALRDEVFAMFRRAHDRGRYAGSGIGLALCRRIVEAHGGRISLGDRAGGRGTEVRVVLPAADPAP